MPLRVFRSSAGVEWRVWSVVPGSSQIAEERRRGYDRRSPDPVLRAPRPDRRDGRDRRRRHAALPPDLELGWLVFDNGSEKRRLAPIPPAWEVRADADLERLCSRADLVPPGRSAEDPPGEGEAPTGSP